MFQRLILAAVLLGSAYGLWTWAERNWPTSAAIAHAKQTEDEKKTPAWKGPKLAVLVVFDQLRGDYLIKWKDLFGEGGFKRLQTEGAWFTNCHYPYSDTLTAVGHTSLATGCTPREHGIIANDWYSRKLGKKLPAVYDDKDQKPDLRQRPTFADALLEQFPKTSKIAGLSIKDRSAMLIAALRAHLCYWLNRTRGQFETSRHYRADPHRWVTQFNKSGAITASLNKDWGRFRPDLDYAKFSGPDDVKSEGEGYKQGRTFPHPTIEMKALENSPFGNELLLKFAKVAIEQEKLGQRNAPDFLGLSFSSNDLVGHCYGPDSQEVLDITLRTDVIIKELLDFLDAKVGKGQYILVLSADHGVCSLPEVAKAQGKDAERVPVTILTSEAEAFLQDTFAPGEPKVSWIEAQAGSWVYLNKKVLENRGLDQAKVEKALADKLVQDPRVLASFTRSQLSTDTPFDDPLAEQVRQSFHPEQSGDVMVVLKPNHLLWDLKRKESGYTTTHGSPHSYDTHVPLLVFGAGVKPGVYEKLVRPQSACTILARGLGVEAPKTARFPVPEGLFGK